MLRIVGLPRLTAVAAAVVATLLAASVTGVVPGTTTGPAGAAVVPVHTLAVSGTGVGMYPAFVPGTDRYAVTTTGATAGSVTVDAATSDPSGSVLVDGRPVPGGHATLTGLTEGDEVSVWFEDSAGIERHTLVYLPAGFPAMVVVTNRPGTAPGDVLLTLSRFGSGLTFEAAVDRNGVPAYVHGGTTPTADLKRLSSGHYTVARAPTKTPGKTGYVLTELDDRFRVLHTYETTGGVVNTDSHDSILRPDGSRILLAYEKDQATGRVDAIIQDVDAQGRVTFQWNSLDHVDPATDGVGGPLDYAHVNSIQETPGGDLLVSFRNLSQVMKIAWSDHGTYRRGDVIWRLGGRRSDFAFVGDPFPGGPCAQHSARQLADGNILLFDNGATGICVDPADRTGPTVSRPETRITEYALDADLHTATLVWSWEPQPHRFALFAGSAQRLSNGDTMVGWAAATQALATEVSPSGEVLWELADPDAYFSYRSTAAVVPDTVPPAVDVAEPATGATYAFGAHANADFACTDRGGSSLRTCTGSHAWGTPLDTSAPGDHTFTVTARDGAGNITTVKHSYQVAPEPVRRRPDALIRSYPDGPWVGGDGYGTYFSQLLHQSIRRARGTAVCVVRLQNDGNRTERLSALGTRGTAAFAVRYAVGGVDVSAAVKAGSYRTPRLAPGAASAIRVTVTRLAAARVGDERTFRVRAHSVNDPSVTDAVATVVRARRR